MWKLALNLVLFVGLAQFVGLCTVQLSRCFERSRNAQNFLIPSKNVLQVTRASLASDLRVTRKFYVIQFASDAQSSFDHAWIIARCVT